MLHVFNLIILNKPLSLLSFNTHPHSECWRLDYSGLWETLDNGNVLEWQEMHNAILNASTLETMQANLTKQVLVSFTCIIPHTNFYSPSKAIVCCIGTDL